MPNFKVRVGGYTPGLFCPCARWSWGLHLLGSMGPWGWLGTSIYIPFCLGSMGLAWAQEPGMGPWALGHPARTTSTTRSPRPPSSTRTPPSHPNHLPLPTLERLDDVGLRQRRVAGHT